MNLIEAAIIKAKLRDPNQVIIVPSPVGAKALEAAGIPKDRIGVLMSVWAANGYRNDDKGQYLLMTKRQYGIWKRKEEELINDVEGTEPAG